MKRLKLNQLNKSQALSLEAKRGSCIVSNAVSTPILEFTVISNDGINCLSIDDSKQVHIITWDDAVRLKEYLSATIEPTHSYDDPDKFEYVATYDMNWVDKEEWEKKERGCVIEGDVEGLLELRKSYYYCTDDNGNKIKGSEKSMIFMAMSEENSNSEAYICLSKKDDIRKLRDYLNNYLEDNL